MRKSLLAVAFVAVLTLVTGTAMADLIQGNYGGQNFSADVNISGGQATVNLTGPTGYTTNTVAIQVSSPISSASLSSGPTGWSATESGPTAGCSNGANWLCATGPSTGIDGLSVVFNFSGGNQTVFSAWFNIYDASGKFVSNFSCKFGENKTDTNGNTCGSTSTPEPASIGLLAAGLLGLGGLVRRRK